MERQIGQVTHYYNHIGVAVLNLDQGLKVGDMIRVRGRHTDFTQTVESMEIEHQKVELAGPGADVALKVAQRVRDGDTVYSVVAE